MKYGLLKETNYECRHICDLYKPKFMAHHLAKFGSLLLEGFSGFTYPLFKLFKLATKTDVFWLEFVITDDSGNKSLRAWPFEKKKKIWKTNIFLNYLKYAAKLQNNLIQLQCIRKPTEKKSYCTVVLKKKLPSRI